MELHAYTGLVQAAGGSGVSPSGVCRARLVSSWMIAAPPSTDREAIRPLEAPIVSAASAEPVVSEEPADVAATIPMTSVKVAALRLRAMGPVLSGPVAAEPWGAVRSSVHTTIPGEYESGVKM